MIINIKRDDGYDLLLNFQNVLYVNRNFDSGYRIMFKDASEIHLSWKEYDKLTKALEAHGK